MGPSGSLQLPRAEAPTTWTGLEKAVEEPQILTADWSTDGQTHVGTPTASLLMLATPPPAQLPREARSSSASSPSKHSTLRPPAPPPDAAVTTVRLPPHPAPRIELPEEAPVDEAVSTVGVGERSTRPGFASEGDLERVEESGLHPRHSSQPPFSEPVREKSTESPPSRPDDLNDGLPGWMRRRRQEELRLERQLHLAPQFSEPPADGAALRDRHPSRAERGGSLTRRRLALRVGLLAFAIVAGLGATIALVL